MKTSNKAQVEAIAKAMKERNMSTNRLSELTRIRRTRMYRLVNGTYEMTLREAHILSIHLDYDFKSTELCDALIYGYSLPDSQAIDETV